VEVYRDFATLRQHEQSGFDYVILSRAGSSGLLIMAPHGGGIEPGTGDIADALAGSEHAFYCFKGIKKQGNRVLHLTSNRFDEPVAERMLQDARWVLTIHGCRDVEPLVWVGGRDLQRGDIMITTLLRIGIPARRCHRPGLRGLEADNVCNRGRAAVGVQLEVSGGLRRMLFSDLFRRPLRCRTPLFYRFVNTLESCLPDRTEPG
jgi:phage replication-related protein YjqB (UPF0714/DUF867 family)